MGKKLNINPGDKFNRLTIIKEVEKRKNFRFFLCLCDCGNEKVISMNSIVRGRTKSCGCYCKEIKLLPKPEKRKNTREQFSKVLYSRWSDIKKRCYNKNCRAYKWYGAKGIKVCEEWEKSFNSFYEWSIKNNFEPKLTFDRKDFTGNYEPSNCRLIPLSKQNSNKCSNRFIAYNGETKILDEWAKTLGIKYHTLCGRLNHEWSIQKAFETPVERRFSHKNEIKSA